MGTSTCLNPSFQELHLGQQPKEAAKSPCEPSSEADGQHMGNNHDPLSWTYLGTKNHPFRSFCISKKTETPWFRPGW